MSLQDVKGQARAIAILRRIIGNGSINSSFLFSGRQGIGKHLAAAGMAKAVNCTGIRQEPWISDDTCESCTKIDGNIHPDVLQLEIPLPDETSQMDAVVQAIAWINTPLFEGRQKVLIVDDASELNIHAQNAMLKTLEEPPPWSTIIFVAASPARLLPTVQSRLIKVGFNRLSEEVIREILSSVTPLNGEQINYVSLFADGSIRYTTPGDIEHDVRSIVTLLGEVREPDSMVKLAEKFKAPSYKDNFDQILGIVLSFFLDAVILQATPSLVRLRGFSDDIRKFADRFGQSAILRAAWFLEKARYASALNISPQMIMEQALFQLTGDTHDH